PRGAVGVSLQPAVPAMGWGDAQAVPGVCYRAGGARSHRDSAFCLGCRVLGGAIGPGAVARFDCDARWRDAGRAEGAREWHNNSLWIYADAVRRCVACEHAAWTMSSRVR